jgi:CBS domain-containing protein
MKARDVMASHVITVGPELDVKAVANTLVANGISAVPVVAIDGSVVGIISEGDLMRRAVSGAERKRSRWLETFSSAEQLMAEFVKAHGRKTKDVMTRSFNLSGIRSNWIIAADRSKFAYANDLYSLFNET